MQVAVAQPPGDAAECCRLSERQNSTGKPDTGKGTVVRRVQTQRSGAGVTARPCGRVGLG
ncbi:hypothetical protein Scel_11710 [Streptomyces cellostaticus]|nr:hypothetical protein Scel_11710 [Streptomyces cellostaticus]